MTRFGPWIDGGIFDHAPMAFVNTTVEDVVTGFWGTSADTGLIGGPTDIGGASGFWSPGDYSSVYTTAADRSSWVAGQNETMFQAFFDMIREPFPDWSWEYFVAMGTQAKALVAYVPWFLDPTFTGLPDGAVGFEIEGGAAYCTVLALEVGTARSWVVSDSTADSGATADLANVTGTARLRALLAEPAGVFTPDVDLGPHYDVDWAGPSTFDAADPIVDEVDLTAITTPVDSADPGGTFDLTPYLGGPPEAGLFFGYQSLEEFSLPTPGTTPPDDESQITVDVTWNLESPIYTVQAPRRRFIYDTTLVPIQRLIRRDDHGASAGRVYPPPKSGQAGTRILGGYI